MIFYYIRHGNPIYNPDSLTDLGHEQAKALAPRFLKYGIDEIYASTSNRAILTAKPTADLLNKEITLCDWANEGHAWGELTMPLGEDKLRWVMQHPDFVEKLRAPEFEALGYDWYEHASFATKRDKMKAGMERISKAADEFFLSLGFRHKREINAYVREGRTPPKRVALFAHQGFGLAFLSTVLDIPYLKFCANFDISHSAVTTIYFDETREIIYPTVLQFASEAHLYKEGVKSQYDGNIDI